MRRSLLLIGLALVFGVTSSCSPNCGTFHDEPVVSRTRQLDHSEAVDDVYFLFHAIDTTHPDPSFKLGPSRHSDEKTAIINALNRPVSEKDFWTTVASFLASIGEPHTSIDPETDEYSSFAKTGGLLFPLDVQAIHGSLYVVEDHSSGSPVPFGSQIMAINGIPTDNILGEIEKSVSGDNKEVKDWLIAGDFRAYLWQIFGFSGNFCVTYSPPASAEETAIDLSGISQLDIDKWSNTQAAYTEQANYTFSEPSVGVALLTLRSFRASIRPQFDDFLASSFARMKSDRDHALIVDIRNNVGGSTDLSEDLLEFLTNKPFRQISSGEFLSSGHVVDFRNVLTKPKPTPLLFKGRVYILVGPGTYSTAAMFAGTVRYYKAGILVGEPTGGTPTLYGNRKAFTLPHSHFAVYVSQNFYVGADGSETPNPVNPDVPVPADPHEDRTLETAIGLAGHQ